jgi:hypothetical protein
MRHTFLCAALGLVAVSAGLAAEQAAAPQFTSDNQLIRPTDYREWIYLTSGLGMSYGPAAAQQATDANPVFDNVFVNPASYKAFIATGKWPDKTIFILEIRSSSSHGSINKAGHFQSDVVAVEAAVKDEAHIPEKWGYFGFPGPPGGLAKTAKAFGKTAGCLACHTANGATDNTFVQFYPTLYEVAEAKGTLNASFPRPAPTPAGFYHIISAQGWDKAHAQLQESKVKDPEAAIFKESSLNRLGYQLLGAGKKSEAVATLKFATGCYPASPNAYDSLAEAYEANGEKQHAIQASEKALALVADDTQTSADRKRRLMESAKQRIERLQK